MEEASCSGPNHMCPPELHKGRKFPAPKKKKIVSINIIIRYLLNNVDKNKFNKDDNIHK